MVVKNEARAIKLFRVSTHFTKYSSRSLDTVLIIPISKLYKTIALCKKQKTAYILSFFIACLLIKIRWKLWKPQDALVNSLDNYVVDLGGEQ